MCDLVFRKLLRYFAVRNYVQSMLNCGVRYDIFVTHILEACHQKLKQHFNKTFRNIIPKMKYKLFVFSASVAQFEAS